MQDDKGELLVFAISQKDGWECWDDVLVVPKAHPLATKEKLRCVELFFDEVDVSTDEDDEIDDEYRPRNPLIMVVAVTVFGLWCLAVTTALV